MTYNILKDHLLRIISHDEAELNKYKLRQNCSQFIIQRRSDIHKSVREFINLADSRLPGLSSSYPEAIEVIKKQALIIKAAGITYPTINQSLNHLQDIYFASKGQDDKIGSANIEPITIEII